MFNPSFFERILHKVKMKTIPLFSSFRRKRLNNKNFTIIANNCWGGICYEYFGLPKQSPTVGTFIFAKDYIKFVKNLKYYLNIQIRFIDCKKSNYYYYLKEKNIECPIGILDDVEIFFLHYANEKIAKEKWTRRVNRVNWNNLIFKFSFMNECTLNHLEEFDKLDLPGKKFMFVNKPNMGFDCGVYYPGYENENTIDNDTFYWNNFFDVVHFLNR